MCRPITTHEVMKMAIHNGPHRTYVVNPDAGDPVRAARRAVRRREMTENRTLPDAAITQFAKSGG